MKIKYFLLLMRCFIVFLSFVSFCLVSFSYSNEPPKIYVFIHVCTVSNGKEILGEQLSRIKKSGLYLACESIFIGVLGPGHIQPFIEKYPKLKVLFQDPNIQLYERPTLLSLHDLCRKHPDALILYLHTKGVTHAGQQHIEDWRRFMEYFNIDKWKECILALTDEKYDVCGVNWHLTPSPHFSGNFWWAKACYISTLPHHIEPSYFSPEMWLGQNAPRSRSFHESMVNHYYTAYPEYCYKPPNSLPAREGRR